MIDKKLHHTHAHTHTTRTKVGGTEDLLMLIPDDTTLDWLDGEAKDLRVRYEVVVHGPHAGAGTYTHTGFVKIPLAVQIFETYMYVGV